MPILALLSVPTVLADVPEAVPVEVESYRGHRPPPPPPPPRRPPPPPPPRPAPKADPGHDLSLTLSTTDLGYGLLTGNLEARLAPEVSLGGTLGLGGWGRYRLGGELRGYVVGNFDRGLFLGAGVESTNVGWFDLDGGAVGVSGFGGAKLALPPGFTLEGKLGVEALGDGAVGYLQPVAALNLGWSF